MHTSTYVTVILVMKLSFSLANKSKEKPVGVAPSLKRPAAFASIDDDATEDAPHATSSTSKGVTNRRLIAQNVEMSKAVKKRMEAEKQVDSTVFEYDEVWDHMQESKLRQKEVKEQESKERKVRILDPFSRFLRCNVLASVA